MLVLRPLSLRHSVTAARTKTASYVPGTVRCPWPTQNHRFPASPCVYCLLEEGFAFAPSHVLCKPVDGSTSSVVRAALSSLGRASLLKPGRPSLPRRAQRLSCRD